MIPVVAANMMIALGPRLYIPFKSMLRHRSTKLAGSKYLEATKYKLEVSPSTIPRELNAAGIK